jgi:hypothetical protein
MRYAATFVLIFSTLTLSGCGWLTPTVESPWSHKPVTADQLASEQGVALVRAQADAQAKADELALAAKRRKADYERAVGKASLDAQGVLSDLSAKYDADSDEAALAASKLKSATDAAIAAIKSSGDVALAELQRKQEALSTIGGLFTSAGQAAGAFGPIGAAASLVLTGVGGIIGHRIGKSNGVAVAQAEAADEHSKLVTEHQQALNDNWDQAQQALTNTMQLLRGAGLHLPAGLTLVQPPAPATPAPASAAA